MQRIVEKLVTAGGLDDPTRIHDIDYIADLRHYGQIVRDEYDSRSKIALAFTDQVENLFLHRDIKSSGRFVANQQFRLRYQSHGNHHTLCRIPPENS